MKGGPSPALDGRIAELVNAGSDVTIGSLGGVDSIQDDDVDSPLFPYVANALVEEWGDLTSTQQGSARQLVSLAVSRTPSAVALADICKAVVPVAEEIQIVPALKNALRGRLADRSDQQRSALAAIALRWLTNLAVVTDGARGALVDALSEVAVESSEPALFSSAAAQVAGVVYDRWRDAAAASCLSRLAETASDADTWFALGQSRLLDALDADGRESCLAGLTGAIECFDHAVTADSSRPEVAMYASSIRFVLEWSVGATSEMLLGHCENARRALDEYVASGYRLPEQAGWLRPRYEAETTWINLVRSMEQVAGGGSGDAHWYHAGTALGALADVYRTANTLYPERTVQSGPASALPEVLAPRLVAPFVGHSERLAYIDMWLEEVGGPDAEAFAAFVRERAEKVVPPKARRPGNSRR